MPDRISEEHVSPETFVDLLEGAPVDASHRQHLARCQDCRRELEELERTLSVLRTDAGAELPAVPARRWQRTVFWAGAAAVLALVLVSQPRNPSDGSASTEAEQFLPDIDEDPEYRVLLAISLETEDSEVVLDAVHFSEPFSPDLYELTPSERRSLAEELVRLLRSRS
jgi:hypothetical protein